jgi:transposase-like protein
MVQVKIAECQGGVYLRRMTNELRDRVARDREKAVDRAGVIEAVLDGMANGKTVADVSRGLGLNPGTVRKWMAEDEDTMSRYQRSRPMLGAALAEEAIRVARESTAATTAMDRVLIETLKWAASKSAPMEYGDKQTVEHQGSQMIQVKVVEEDREGRNPRVLGAASGIAVVANIANQLSLPEKTSP